MHNELIVDNFAGGGGASNGIYQALGRHVDIAINHNEEAIAMHRLNHPKTTHLVEDVFLVDPIDATYGRPVGLAWFSPDCTHHSRARGGKPRNNKIRGLAWVILYWVTKVKPRVIMMENVSEFQDWAPLTSEGTLSKWRKGWTFQTFVGALKRRGYEVDYRELRASDYDTPTIRKRLFLIARCDGKPIVWPDPTNGEGLEPHRQTAECIDWSIPAPSIFTRKRPLADSTCQRVAKGIFRYVIDHPDPFTVELPETMPAVEPLRAQCAQVKGGHALVSAFLAKNYTGVVGSSMEDPLGTVTSVDHHSLVTAHLIRDCSTGFGSDMREPLRTIMDGESGKARLVHAFLTKYYGNEKDGVDIREPMHTITSKGRFGLVTVHGYPYRIYDIGLRMLQPPELYRAQGFPLDYIYDRGLFDDGTVRKLTKTAQVRMCGNSVPPPLVRALVWANVPEMAVEKMALV